LLICTVVGARPNFMKMAPIVLELKRRGLSQLFVHTGQHYDKAMSDVFFQELALPEPDVHLGVGSDNHARQTAQIMTSFDQMIVERRPGLVVVGGDVNSTMAVALVAAKYEIPVAHVEAGLRSFDRSMPEEINRVVTDHVSELLFTTEESGNVNLRREGIPEDRIHFVGNCMVDTLRKHVAAAVAREPWRPLGLSPDSYALLTLHRPSNVDADEPLKKILGIIEEIGRRMPIVFPIHPRTRARLEGLGWSADGGVKLMGPLPYLTFAGLMARARLVLTDSGGVQEETTALGVPCLTLRENTERPVTVTDGTNQIVGTDPRKISGCVSEILAGSAKSGRVPPLWDGRASERVVDVLEGRARSVR
jgi:UDP-N-acetylglucosamine 2-epimerase (non-hydrolysing)